jgi:hypothetical protein
MDKFSMICIHHNSSAISIQDSDRLSIPITSDRPSKNNQSAIAYPSHKQRSPLKKQSISDRLSIP